MLRTEISHLLARKFKDLLAASAKSWRHAQTRIQKMLEVNRSLRLLPPNVVLTTCGTSKFRCDRLSYDEQWQRRIGLRFCNVKSKPHKFTCGIDIDGVGLLRTTNARSGPVMTSCTFTYATCLLFWEPLVKKYIIALKQRLLQAKLLQLTLPWLGLRDLGFAQVLHQLQNGMSVTSWPARPGGVDPHCDLKCFWNRGMRVYFSFCGRMWVKNLFLDFAAWGQTLRSETHVTWADALKVSLYILFGLSRRQHQSETLFTNVV